MTRVSRAFLTTALAASFCLCSGRAEAAISVGTVNATTNGGTAATSLTLSAHIVPSGSDRLLVVAIGADDTGTRDWTIKSVTFGGTPLTPAVTQTENATRLLASIWYMVAPPVSTADLEVTFYATVTNIALAAINLTGVYQGNPLDATAGTAFANIATPSISITTVADNSIIISTITRSISGVITSDQGTEIYDQSIGASTQHTGNWLINSPAGAQTMSYSMGTDTDEWAHAIASFSPSGVSYTWDGGGGADANWNTVANWTSNTVPTPNATAVFDGTSTNNCTINVNPTVAALNINSGYTGNVALNANRLMVDDFAQAAGTFTVTSGRVVVFDAFNQTAGTFTPGTGTTVLSGGSASRSHGSFASAQSAVRVESSKTNGLVAYWKLDENGSTAVRDGSGNGYHGVFVSNGANPAWSASLPSTISFDNRSSLDFAATTLDRVEFGAPSALQIVGDLTLSAWVSYDAVNTGTWENTIISAGDLTDVAAGNYPYLFNLLSTFSLQLFWEYGAGTNVNKTSTVAISPAPAAGSWHHYAVTREASTRTVKFYYDGAQLGADVTYTAAQEPTGGSNTVVMLGVDADLSGGDLDGRLDDVRVYSRVLSSSEVQDLASGFYATGSQGTTTATIGGNLSAGTLTLDSGIFDANGSNVTVTSLLTLAAYSGEYRSGSGTSTLNGGLAVSGGLFTGGSGNVDVNGDLTANNSATFTAPSGNLNVSGNWTVSSGSTFTHNSGTVIVDGSAAQSLDHNGTGGLYNLTIANTSATVSINTSCSAAANLTINAGAVLRPAASVVVSGAGTLTGSGTAQVTRATGSGDFQGQYAVTNKTLTNLTVELVGAAAQGVNANTFGGLKINNASGVTLGGDVTVNATLTLASGNISTGANKVVITSTGTVSRTSGHVVGNLEKNVATGSSVSRTFQIGSASTYTPVDVVFASVSVAGNLTASAAAGDHPNIASSDVNPGKSVNRYWTMSMDASLVFTSYGATFNFVSGDVDEGASTSTFGVRRYSGGAWSALTVGTRTSTSTEITGATAFGDFQVGNVLSVVVSNSVFAFGTQLLNTWLAADSSVVTNDGTETEAIVGKISTFTVGASTWALSPSANGPDQVRSQWSTSTAAGPWTDISAYDTNFTIVSSLAPSATVKFYFRILTPTSSTSLGPYASTLTVTAQ